MLHRPLPGTTGDIALLVGRIVLGVVLIAHGWQKLVTNGFGATSAGFAKIGVPLPPVSAAYATVVELAGGVLLLAGALTTLVAVLVMLDMLGAIATVHIANGVFVTSGGWELAGSILVAALLFAAAGAGRFSLDHALRSRSAAPAAN